jgi:DNA-binding CsgD family transcriptional regulator
MRAEERLSGLIGDIYDASLNPTLWEDVLEQIARFATGPAASLYSKDAVVKSSNVVYQFGLDPKYVQLYLEKYSKLDPNTTGYFFAGIGEPIGVADLMPYEEFLATRFYREWAQPQGLVDSANAILEKSLTTGAFVVVFRHERNGIVDDEMRRRMRLIIPHIRRAALIGKAIDLKNAEVATFSETLDGISAGMFLVDMTGRIVHANRAGYLMIDARNVLANSGNRLVAGDPQIDQALRDIFAASADGDAAIGTRGIAMALTGRDGERHVAHVLPLTSGKRRKEGDGDAAAAALFVCKAAPDTRSPLEIIAKAYKLTPTELRVLHAMVEVGGVPEVADALGVARATIRTHLLSVFAKTGTRRQADLVKLVAGFSNPLLG